MEEKKYEDEKLEAQKRFDALPDNLKRGVQADKNVQLIATICQDYSLPEEKIKYVIMLVGEVFLGYIKPEEVAHELNTYFDIDLQKANFIEIELKQKLFNSLKPDLDKIYNPLSAEVLAKEDIKTTEEVSPAMIKLEADIPAQSFENIPTPQPVKIEGASIQTTSSAPLSEAMAGEQDKPFIIQTKVEAVKPAMPQFSKGAPSLNLKVDPSIIQKTPIIKPVSVRLEAVEPVQEKKFQMPVIAGQKVFSGAPQEASITMLKTEIKPIQTAPPSSSEQINLQGKPMELKQGLEFINKKIDPAPIKKSPVFEEIKIPVQQKVITSQPQAANTLSLKQISEQKIVPPESTTTESAKIVHYSTFKTDLAHPSAPKKSESTPSTSSGQGKDDFINLNTFMRVSGNTVDLRSDKQPTKTISNT